MVGLEAASEVASAATALAGLILVYLGSVAAGFDSFRPEEKRANKPRYARRATWGFAGMLVSLLAALLAVAAKWFQSEGTADAAVIVLAAAFAFGIWIAYLTAEDLFTWR